MGSQFKGVVRDKLHRRLGNVCFTLLQCVLFTRWLQIEQSGTASKEAMERVNYHEYNYPQVLHDWLARLPNGGSAYSLSGSGLWAVILSFKYLISVLPAIWKEMRRPMGNRQREVLSQSDRASSAAGQDGRVRRERRSSDSESMLRFIEKS